MITFRMSEAGGCIKALVASKLGYEAVPEDVASLRRMRAGTRREAWAANDIELEDKLKMSDSGICAWCGGEFGETRRGWHCEINTPLVRLIGHIDRMVEIEGKLYPVEIKNLGTGTFYKFRKEGLNKGYAAQEVCYLEATKLPGMYLVMHRDDDELQRYTIPYNGTFLVVPGFKQLELTVTFEEVIDNIHLAALSVEEGKLPEVDQSKQNCGWCRYLYLCDKSDKKASVEVPALSVAADMWREGKALFAEGEAKIEQAKEAFLKHAKDNKLDKYSSGGLSIDYYGERQRTYLDEVKLRELVPETTLKLCEKQGKVWDDLRIR